MTHETERLARVDEAVARLSDGDAMDLAISLARHCNVEVGQPDVDGRNVGEIIGSRVRASLLRALTEAP